MVWFPHLLAIEQFTLTPHGNQESETAYNYNVTQILFTQKSKPWSKGGLRCWSKTDGSPLCGYVGASIFKLIIFALNPWRNSVCTVQCVRNNSFSRASKYAPYFDKLEYKSFGGKRGHPAWSAFATLQTSFKIITVIVVIIFRLL